MLTIHFPNKKPFDRFDSYEYFESKIQFRKPINQENSTNILFFIQMLFGIVKIGF